MVALRLGVAGRLLEPAGRARRSVRACPGLRAAASLWRLVPIHLGPLISATTT